MKSLTRAAVLAAVVLCAPAHAETHALIMGIGAYNMPGIAPLTGIPQDIVMARDMARRLGVREKNITVLRDGDLTWDGMDAAFDRLRSRIAPDDDVFIYYSGHGTRQLVKEPEERCAESLVTYDGKGFIDSDVETKLKALSSKANKLVMFLDACHSGGVTTRSGNTRFAPKYVARSGGEACERPVNVLKRNLTNRSAGSQNYVYIAAARDNEISLDETDKGGIATQAWHECMTGRAKDLDGSGAISAGEMQACAQQLIDRKLANVQGFSAHHISITGNQRAVLRLSDAGPAAPSAPATTVSPSATLKDILASRDDRRTVTLSSAQRLKIGRDRFELAVTSSHAGYVYVLMAGSDGKSFDLLFPNKLDGRNQVAANETVRLPRGEWEVNAGGPPGTTDVLVMVTETPRDFSALPLQPAGPFSVVEATPLAAKDIVLVTTSAPAATQPECSDPLARRNLAVAKKCSNAYGAALVSVEEVQ